MKDLFNICATVAGTMEVQQLTATVGLPDDSPVKPWIPTLYGSIDAIIKKDIGVKSDLVCV